MSWTILLFIAVVYVFMLVTITLVKKHMDKLDETLTSLERNISDAKTRQEAQIKKP